MAQDATERLGWRYAKLWAASTTSALGSGLATIAAPLLVASRTSNPLIVSAAFGVSWLPWLLFALPGGVLVDRVDRRRLMIAIDWSRVAVMGVLAAAIAAGHASITLLYVVLFLINTGEIVFRSASQAMIPAVVPRARLERANGWLYGGFTLMQGMIAGPLGGFLFVLAASVPFFVNAGTYAASAILIGLVAGRYRSAPGSEPAGAAGTAAGSAAGKAVHGAAGKTVHGAAGKVAGSGAGKAAGSGAGKAADGAPGGAADGATAKGAGRPRRARSVRAEVAEGFRWLAGQRVLRTMAVLIGLLNLTLTASEAVLVLLARDRLHLGSVGYGLLFTAMAAGGILGSLIGDRLIRWVTATWTIRIGLLIEAGMHLALAASHSAYLIGFALFAFGVHGTLWGIVGSSLRQRLTPPAMLGRVGSTILFIAAGGNCAGALLGGVIAARFGLTAPYWVGFVVAILVSASTWRVFNRAAVARAYSEPAPGAPGDQAGRPGDHAVRPGGA